MQDATAVNIAFGWR